MRFRTSITTIMAMGAIVLSVVLPPRSALAYLLVPFAGDWQLQASRPGNTDVQLDTDMDGRWVAMWAEVPPGGDKAVPFVSRSTDKGHSWTPPEAVIAPGPLSWKVTSLAAGEGGAWMATLHTASDTFDRSPSVIRSLDGGVTWSAPLDLEPYLPVDGPLTARDYIHPLLLQAGYCGNSCWIIQVAGKIGMTMLRSTDNGASWASQGARMVQYANFVGKPGAPECLLVTRKSEARIEPTPSLYTTVALEFSYDHGATFAAPLIYETYGSIDVVPATDGAGRWVVALSNGSDINQISLLHSDDHGRTFLPRGSAPQGFRKPDSVAYSRAGDIVLFAQELIGPADSFPQNYYGYTSRTSNLGNTWSPWTRIYSVERFGINDRYTGGPVDVEVDAKNHFVAAGRTGSKSFWDQRPEEQPRMMQLFTLQGTPPAAATDWQLYE